MRAEPGRQTVFVEFQAKNLASSSNDYFPLKQKGKFCPPPLSSIFLSPGISVTHFASPDVSLDATVSIRLSGSGSELECQKNRCRKTPASTDNSTGPAGVNGTLFSVKRL